MRNPAEYENEYSQRHRMDIYVKALQQLKEDGLVFACTCSRAQVLSNGADKGYPGACRNKHIPLDTEKTSLRLLTDDKKGLLLNTLTGVVTTTLPVSMQDFIVKRKDNIPAYQLISILDDEHYGVDLVVRGDDLWASTLAQLYLSAALKQSIFPGTTFYHHPLIIGADGNKLSKSEGATSVHYLRMEHKSATDIYTIIGETLSIKEPVTNWESLVANLNLDF